MYLWEWGIHLFIAFLLKISKHWSQEDKSINMPSSLCVNYSFLHLCHPPQQQHNTLIWGSLVQVKTIMMIATQKHIGSALSQLSFFFIFSLLPCCPHFFLFLEMEQGPWLRVHTNLAMWRSLVPFLDKIVRDVKQSPRQLFACLCEINGVFQTGRQVPQTISLNPFSWFRINKSYDFIGL